MKNAFKNRMKDKTIKDFYKKKERERPKNI